MAAGFKSPYARTIIIAISALASVGAAGKWGWTSFVQTPLTQFEKQSTAAKAKKDKTFRQVLSARAADGDLAEFETLCLPGQPSLAQEQFQKELIELFKTCRVGTPTMTPGSPVIRSDVVVVPYTIQGETDQAGLARFLYELRKAPRLRQVRRLSLTPTERGDISPAIRFSLTIEALGLGDATERVPPESFAPSVRAKLDEYAGWLGRPVLSARGPLTAALQPNAPEYVMLTGVVRTANKGEASIFDRATGDSRKLRVGDKPGIKGDNSVVRDLGLRDVILERDGKFFIWQLGTPFQSRQPLSIEQALEREAKSRRETLK